MALFILLVANVLSIIAALSAFSIAAAEPVILFSVIMVAIFTTQLKKRFVVNICLFSLSLVYLALIVVKPVAIHNLNLKQGEFEGPRTFLDLGTGFEELKKTGIISYDDTVELVVLDVLTNYVTIEFSDYIISYNEYSEKYVPALEGYQRALVSYKQLSELLLLSIPCDVSYTPIFIPAPGSGILEADVAEYNNNQERNAKCFKALEESFRVSDLGSYVFYKIYKPTHRSSMWDHKNLEPVVYNAFLINLILSFIIILNLTFIVFQRKYNYLPDKGK